MGKNDKRVLELPYIGIKIDSIPTILNILKNSDTDENFYEYYESYHKKRKTSSEYLSSLRNLKLACYDKEKNTRLTKDGIKLLNSPIDKFYNILLNHCLKHYSDLVIVKDIIKGTKKINLNIVNAL